MAILEESLSLSRRETEAILEGDKVIKKIKCDKRKLDDPAIVDAFLEAFEEGFVFNHKKGNCGRLLSA